MRRQVIVVGAGPTGATLALLLSQRGIKVTLVEASKEFRRIFRGEGLMPSGLDALEQMGLASLLKDIPTRPLDAWVFTISGQPLFHVAESMGCQHPCTLVSQPPLLEAIITKAKQQPSFEFIQGVAVKEFIYDSNQPERIAGVTLTDGRTLEADLVIGADGRNSIVRQRAGLELVTEPKSMDVLWFKLPTHQRLAESNTFHSIVNQGRVFSAFHTATEGQMHVAWVTYPGEESMLRKSSQDWADIFAKLSPVWLADHFRHHANQISAPIRLSVLVGRCPIWHKPGVLLLGDAAHPMSPVRAQGINMAFRDVMVAVNQLAPILQTETEPVIIATKLDQAIATIQAEREPEIIRIQRMQAEEASRGELLRSNPVLKKAIQTLPQIFGPVMKRVWTHKQKKLRKGIDSIQLTSAISSSKNISKTVV